MRILHAFPVLGTGGTERVILQIARFMKNNCNAATAICTAGGTRRAEFDTEGISVLTVPGFCRKLWFAENVRAILSSIRGYHPDVIHTHSLYALIVAYLAVQMSRKKIAIVHTGHGGPRKFYDGYALCFAWMADRYIALSAKSCDCMRRVYSENKIRFIPNGVEEPPGAEVYRPAAAGDRSLFSLAFIGRLSKEKGIFLLIEAVRLLREQEIPVTLEVVGEGDLRKELERLVIRLGLERNIHFFGYLQTPWSAVARTAIVVMPSLWENSGLVAYEAIVRNHTLVASRLPAFRDHLRHGENAYLFEAGNVSELANILGAIWRSKLPLLFSKGKAPAEMIFIKSTGPQMQAVYEQLIDDCAM